MPDVTRTSGDDPELSNKAFAAQRRRIKELEEEIEELKADREFSGDDENKALQKKIRMLEKRLDAMMVQGIDETELELVMAEHSWLGRIPDKTERVRAAKEVIALRQGAGTNAGGSPGSGRSDNAAAYAHLTGGGPPAGKTRGRSDYEADLAKYREDLRNAETQKQRDQIAEDWVKTHPEEPGMM